MSSYNTVEFTEKNIIDTVERYHMLSPGDTVIIGFSGGADSMTLLSVLKKYESILKIKLVATHVNHCLRGEEAKRDENFCKEIAKSLSIPIEVLSINVLNLAKERHQSFEECGREIRYNFFNEVGRKYAGTGNYKVATAHNANDCAETFLFHLARGTGLNGLTGIPPVRGNVIRPLIRTKRQDIEGYCSELNIEYVTDSTNNDTAYTRNRVRHCILPEMETLNNGAIDNMLRCMELLKRDEEALNEEADRLYENAKIGKNTFNVPVLKDVHKGITSRTIFRIIEEFTGVPPEAVHIEKILEYLNTEGTLQVPTGAYVEIKGEKLRIFKEKKKMENIESFSYELKERLSLPYCDFSFSVFNREENTSIQLENCLDYDKINSNFKVRNRRPGDRFRPPGRKVTKPFKQICSEYGIRSERRSSLLILEDDGGKIAWIEDIGPSEKYKVKNETKTLMEICIIRKEKING